MNLPRTSLTTAMASAVSLAAQAIFSLVMLQFFGPKDVGEFSVVSQIAFFWITLALAQSPLSLLADVHRPPGLALRMALGASVLRLLVLMPLAWMAVNLAEISRSLLCSDGCWLWPCCSLAGIWPNLLR